MFYTDLRVLKRWKKVLEQEHFNIEYIVYYNYSYFLNAEKNQIYFLFIF